MLAVTISTLTCCKVLLAQRTDAKAMKLEKVQLPLPKRLCTFVRSCMSFGNENEMYFTLCNLKIVAVAGKFVVCSVIYEEVEKKEENYIKTKHLIHVFEKAFKDRLTGMLPKLQEEFARGESESTCLDAFADDELPTEKAWNTLPDFAPFPHYINQIAKYNIPANWLGKTYRKHRSLLLDLSFRLVLGSFPKEARNGIVQRLSKIIKKPETRKTFVYEPYTVHFKKLELWQTLIHVTVQKNQAREEDKELERESLMKKFFPATFEIKNLPFVFYKPEPPATRASDEVGDGIESEDGKQTTDKQKFSRKSKLNLALQRKEEELFFASGGVVDLQCALLRNDEWSVGPKVPRKKTFSQVETSVDIQHPDIKTLNPMESAEVNDMRQSLSKTSFTLKSSGKVEIQSATDRTSLNKGEAMSEDLSNSSQDAVLKLADNTAETTLLLPHVPLEGSKMKPEKSSKSSVIDLTPRDIPIIVDTPR